MKPWSPPSARWAARVLCAGLLAGGAVRAPAAELDPPATTPRSAEASRRASTRERDGDAAPAPPHGERARGGGSPPVRLTPEQAERLRDAARRRGAELRTKRPTSAPPAKED